MSAWTKNYSSICFRVCNDDKVLTLKWNDYRNDATERN